MIVFLVGLVSAFTLDSVGDKNINEGEALSFTLSTSATTGTVTYSKDDGSVGTLNIATGAFTYTPDFDVASSSTQNATFSVTFTATNGTDPTDFETETITITVIDNPRMVISDFDVKVGSKSDNNIEDEGDGYTISDDAEPGDRIKFSIELENLYDDQDIEDVTVTITILDIDDGDDLEEESDQEDIRDGRNKDFDLEFEVPRRVDDDDYKVLIEIEGDPEDGDRIDIVQEIFLTVDKQKHNIVVERAELRSERLSCSRITELDVLVLNLGSEEEDEVRITVMNDDLGIDFEEFDDGDISLETGTDEDAEYRVNIPVDATDVDPGSYVIEVKVYRDETKLEDAESVILAVEECREEVFVPPVVEDDDDEKDVDVVDVSDEDGFDEFPVLAQVEEGSFTQSTAYVVLLSIAAVVLIGLIVAIIIFLVKKEE
ncbi:hypothetical protein GOV09_06815 [Candidatus Woesearchaeota archaeon]|nr:hypothetical protein [Candidatus Woesearchaeota archaeon]